MTNYTTHLINCLIYRYCVLRVLRLFLRVTLIKFEGHLLKMIDQSLICMIDIGKLDVNKRLRIDFIEREGIILFLVTDHFRLLLRRSFCIKRLSNSSYSSFATLTFTCYAMVKTLQSSFLPTGTIVIH